MSMTKLFGVVIWRESRNGPGPWRGGQIFVRAESEAAAIVEASRMVIRTSFGVELGDVLEMRGPGDIEDAMAKVEASRTRQRKARRGAICDVVDGDETP